MGSRHKSEFRRLFQPYQCDSCNSFKSHDRPSLTKHKLTCRGQNQQQQAHIVLTNEDPGDPEWVPTDEHCAIGVFNIKAESDMALYGTDILRSHAVSHGISLKDCRFEETLVLKTIIDDFIDRIFCFQKSKAQWDNQVDL